MVKFGAFENQRPNTPLRLSGPSSGKINHKYTFTVSTTDPNGDQLYYLFDFGDGFTSFWYGPYDSGEKCYVSHIYLKQGYYQVTVKAQDSCGAVSNWSDPLLISMSYSFNPIHLFLEWLFERFPDAFPRLQQLLGYLQSLFLLLKQEKNGEIGLK